MESQEEEAGAEPKHFSRFEWDRHRKNRFGTHSSIPVLRVPPNRVRTAESPDVNLVIQ